MLHYYQLTTEQPSAFHYRREETENGLRCALPQVIRWLLTNEKACAGLKHAGLTRLEPETVLSSLILQTPDNWQTLKTHTSPNGYDDFCFSGWPNVCVCVSVRACVSVCAGWDSLTWWTSKWLPANREHASHIHKHTRKRQAREVIKLHTHTNLSANWTFSVHAVLIRVNKFYKNWIKAYSRIHELKSGSGRRESLQSNRTRRPAQGHANWVIMCCFTRAVSGW